MRLHENALLRRCGITLTEIMLGMVLLAVAFIPIIGVMGTSIRATDKDERTIKAVNLCQGKINRALQFPFGVLEPGPGESRTYGGAASQVLHSSGGVGVIELILGPETIDGMDFVSELRVEDIPGNFEVPSYDPVEKMKNKDDPSKWGWTDNVIPYSGLHYKYLMTVRWRDKGSDLEKFYTLASSKAKVRQ